MVLNANSPEEVRQQIVRLIRERAAWHSNFRDPRERAGTRGYRRGVDAGLNGFANDLEQATWRFDDLETS